MVNSSDDKSRCESPCRDCNECYCAVGGVAPPVLPVAPLSVVPESVAAGGAAPAAPIFGASAAVAEAAAGGFGFGGLRQYFIAAAHAGAALFGNRSLKPLMSAS